MTDLETLEAKARVRKAEAERDHARGVAYRMAAAWASTGAIGPDVETALEWNPEAQAPTGAETDDGE